nr:putative capsid protein [Cressdnaviricota sp.]
MSYAGAVSGGILGYIVGDVPGAIKGARLGYNARESVQSYLNKMAPVTRKRKLSLVQYSSNKKKQTVPKHTFRIVKQKSYSYIPKKSSVSSVVPRTGSSSNSIRAARVRNTVNKKVTAKKSKKVKVSKKFRAQVNQVLTSKTCVGTYTEITYALAQLPQNRGGQQHATSCCPNIGSGAGETLFSPLEVLDAASVLFNNKTASQDAKATASGLGVSVGIDSLDGRTEKIQVLKSSYSIVFKNNTRRTIIMQLYEVTPKNRQNVVEMGSAGSQWYNCMTNEATVPAGSLMTSAINLAGATPNTLYVTPKTCKPYMKLWNVERHDITLDPGQTYDHYMEGPTGLYDFAKYWKPDATGSADEFYNHIPSKTRSVFATYRYDIVARAGPDNTAGLPGRWGSDILNEGLYMEYRKYFKLTCPETTGGIMPSTTVTSGSTAAKQFYLNGIKDVYYHKSWNEGNYAVARRIEETTATENVS